MNPNLFMTKRNLVQACLLGLLFFLSAAAQAQFTFTTNNGAITITGYNTAAGLNMVIPAATNGYPVTAIVDFAFYVSIITHVAIPNSVTNIGDYALGECANLTNITVDPSNPAYSSLGGVLFDNARATLIQFPAGLGGSYPVTNSVTNIGDDAFGYCPRLTSVSIPNSVTSIGDGAFFECTNLTSVTIGTGVTNMGEFAFGYCISLTSVSIPDSGIIGVDAFVNCYSLTNVTIGNGVTSIGEEAFDQCTNLTSVTIGNGVTNVGSYAFVFCTSLESAYFLGNAPPDDGTAFANDGAVVYYLPGTIGWGRSFGSRSTMLWILQSHASSFTGGHFGFNLTGPANSVIVVEACTNLSQAVWLPVATNTFSGSGTSTFSDLQSGAHPTRFYRERSP
jgi:BspA type Leucine rich repeat region (6 copies)